jgi:hypothetical protein
VYLTAVLFVLCIICGGTGLFSTKYDNCVPIRDCCMLTEYFCCCKFSKLTKQKSVL